MSPLLCPSSDVLPLEYIAAPDCLHSTTIVSNAATFDSEGSYLLLRRRPGHATHGHKAHGHTLTLRGEFGPSVKTRLLHALAALPADGQPLTLDLRLVTLLDDSCSNALRQTRWDHVRSQRITRCASPIGPMHSNLDHRGPNLMRGASQLSRCEIAPALSV